MKEQSLIIIGAGASGLMAAKELSPYFDTTILEARDRIGGRINPVKAATDIIESGAEFIHGRLPLTFDLLKKAELKTIAVKGKSYRREADKIDSDEEMFEGWDKLLKKMKALTEDMTMQRFLETHYPGPGNLSFRKMVIAYTEGFDLADPAKASVKKLYEEWNAEEDENFRIKGGYSALTDYLLNEAVKNNCKVLTGKIATEIDWEEGEVTVMTNNDEKFTAQRLLITIPPVLLQQLKFTPSLEEYMEAARNIGFGDVIKVVVKFKETSWQKDAGFFFSDQKYFPTWWTQLPDKAPILTGWSGGPRAAILSREPDELILEKALESLAGILGRTAEELKNKIEFAKVFNWHKEVYSQGGYSYETMYSGIAKKILNTALSNTIFFAGEGLYSGKSPGTVEAALESGKLTARLIRKSA